MAKIKAKINSETGGRKIFINAPGRPSTVPVNDSSTGGGGGEDPPPEVSDDTFLEMDVYGSKLEVYNDGKGIRKKSGEATGYDKFGYYWGKQPFHAGDQLIVKVASDPTKALFIYLDANKYQFVAADLTFYDFAVNLGAGSSSNCRAYDSTGALGSGNTAIAAGNLVRINYQLSGVVIFEKSTDGGGNWTTMYTSAQTPAATLYAGIKTQHALAGVDEIYKNTAVMYDYPTPLAPKKGLIIGDSTSVEHGSYMLGSERYLFTVPEIVAGYTCDNIADGGDTISEQLTLWTAYSDKANVDFIIVLLGLNNLYYQQTQTASQLIAEYQDFIDDINENKAEGCKLIICTMTPAKQRWYDIVVGPGTPEQAQAKWEALNEAIRGEGSTPITGADAVVTSHTTALDDGSGNLEDSLSLGDEIHPNGWGRRIIVDAWRAAMKTLNIIS